MFDIALDFEDIRISSLESSDISSLDTFFKKEGIEDVSYMDRRYFAEKFIESYISENELFLKITSTDKLIGIIKGRIEFKSPHEVWIWYFILDKRLRGFGNGKRILNNLIEYFKKSYGIFKFYVIVPKESTTKNFWIKSGFEINNSYGSYYDEDNCIYLFNNFN